MGDIAVEWGGDLIDGLKAGRERTLKAAFVATQSMAPQVENYMKTNAPWTDRTANARNGLSARGYRDGNRVGIVLFHQVPYGIYLETRFGGKYAIIEPTVQAMTPRVMDRFRRLMERI